MLSHAVTKELHAELKSIDSEIETLRERADAIRKVLGEPPQLTIRWPTGEMRPVPVRITDASIPSEYEGMTLREVVKSHLRKHPGWKAADVTQALRAEGYSRGGSTRFSHRVYNEIWRMQKDGLVEKDADGGFTLR